MRTGHRRSDDAHEMGEIVLYPDQSVQKDLAQAGFPCS